MPIATDLNVRDDLKSKTVEEIVSIQAQACLPYAIAVINVNGDLNLGMMMRSGVLFAAERMLTFGKKRYDRRSTVGAHNYIELVQIESELEGHVVPRAIFDEAMNHYCYQPVFMENSGQDINLFDFSGVVSSGKKPCLVFGNEGYGIPDSFIGNDPCVKIKQLGVMRSLNVSAACAIACHVCSTQLSS